MLIEAVRQRVYCIPVQSAVPVCKQKTTFTYKHMKKHSETLVFLKKKNYTIPTFFPKADFVLQRNDFQLVEELY